MAKFTQAKSHIKFDKGQDAGDTEAYIFMLSLHLIDDLSTGKQLVL